MPIQSIGLSKRLQMQKRDRSNQVTEMTSVGSDMSLPIMCLCISDPANPNSLLELDRKEAGHDGCQCHNDS
jgi:hypothetical protein